MMVEHERNTKEIRITSEIVQKKNHLGHLDSWCKTIAQDQKGLTQVMQAYMLLGCGSE